MAGVRGDDPEAAKKMRQMFGPDHADQMLRQAIHFGWMMLPEKRKTVDELEKQMRRLMDRALKDLREDAEAFGLGK